MNRLKNWFENSLWTWRNYWTFRFDNYEDNIDRLAFFEEINNGWYQMYIYPYDDMYLPIISAERKMRLPEQPYTFYVSEEDYDALMAATESHPKPSESLLHLFQRKLPWDD